MLDHVQADRFYQDNADKVKLNWLCYEYANCMYSAISSSPQLSRYRKNYTESQIADFCLYFSKRMRKSVFDMLTGAEKVILFRTSYAQGFYPDMDVKQMNTLMDVARLSWNRQLSSCSVCNNQCLEEGFDLTDMFDSLAQTGWPTR